MIRIEDDGSSVRVTLDAPATRNALTDRMVDDLLAAVAHAEATPPVRALVMRGAGGTFCSGGDFGRFRELMAGPAPAQGRDPIELFNRSFGALLERLKGAPMVTIAVVEGAAVGGGVGLAACCDFVLAEDGARFAMPEVTLGLPPAQIAPFVAARLGDGPALRLMLTGSRIDADQALACGLADEVLDRGGLDARLAALLAALDRAEPASLRATKAIVQRRQNASLPATLDFAAERFAQALRSGTASEGLAALTGKRAPRWASFTEKGAPR
jgi:isohexenylglutaconyl-CoA hydratase